MYNWEDLRNSIGTQAFYWLTIRLYEYNGLDTYYDRACFIRLFTKSWRNDYLRNERNASADDIMIKFLWCVGEKKHFAVSCVLYCIQLQCQMWRWRIHAIAYRITLHYVTTHDDYVNKVLYVSFSSPLAPLHSSRSVWMFPINECMSCIVGASVSACNMQLLSSSCGKLYNCIGSKSLERG